VLDDWNAFIIETYNETDPSEIISSDRAIIKELAKRLGDLSQDPVNEEKRALWIAHNSLRQKRPMIACDPENSWNEIIPPDHIESESAIGRYWEFLLRRELFWGERMNDDHVVEGVFNIPFVYRTTGWGLKEERVYHDPKGSFTWVAPLADYSDMKKMHHPKITVNYEMTDAYTELANELMSPALKIERKGVWWWTLGLTINVAFLRGLEQFMMDFYDNEKELHALMAFLSDGYMSLLDFLEENHLLTMNNDGSNCGSGGLGFTDELTVDNGAVPFLRNMWGFSESQETVSVSPQMFEEFIFRYQLPLLERFGLNSYGCCEPLNGRWEIIKRIPNLRRVGVSPWADMQDMAEKLKKDYVYCLKLSPVPLAFANMDKEAVRNTIREALKITRDTNAEYIMQDTHTFGGRIQNAIDWCTIVRQEIEN